MAGVNVNSMKLNGPWKDGYVLERHHTLSSDFLGYDSFGNAQFHTARSELGELVYRLKNKNDKETLDPIARAAVTFIEGWAPRIDLIVPVPPSRKRAYEPTAEIAKAIGQRLSKSVNLTAVRKIRNTPELKNTFDYQQRIEMLQDAFEVAANAVDKKSVLLIDDLYRSGATAGVVTRSLLDSGAGVVYFLAMTKTRTRR